MWWEVVKEHCSIEARLPGRTDHQHSEMKPGSAESECFQAWVSLKGVYTLVNSVKKIGKRAKRDGDGQSQRTGQA